MRSNQRLRPQFKIRRKSSLGLLQEVCARSSYVICVHLYIVAGARRSRVRREVEPTTSDIEKMSDEGEDEEGGDDEMPDGDGDGDEDAQEGGVRQYRRGCLGNLSADAVHIIILARQRVVVDMWTKGMFPKSAALHSSAVNGLKAVMEQEDFDGEYFILLLSCHSYSYSSYHKGQSQMTCCLLYVMFLSLVWYLMLIISQVRNISWIMKSSVKKMARHTVRELYGLYPVVLGRSGSRKAIAKAKKELAKKARALIGDDDTPCFQDPESV